MSIYERAGSPYWWTNFIDKDGNRIRLSTKIQVSTNRKDKRAAIQEAARLQATYRPHSKAKTDLEKIKERYLKYAASNKSASTYRVERIALDRFCSWAGKKNVDPLLIEDYKEYRLAFVAERTINRELDSIRALFKKAAAWYPDKIEYNPCDGVGRYPVDIVAESPTFFTKTQVSTILYKSGKTYLHDMILLAVNTGLRQAELIYLQWRDINFDTWTVTVQAKKELGWKPKGRKARMRVVPIPEPCWRMLRQRKLTSISSFVFANKFGEARLNNLQRDLRDFLDRLKLYKKGMGWHTFRHTYASHLAMKGVPMKSIAELLGHRDPRTTDIYSHLSQSHLAEMVERLDFGVSKVTTIKQEEKEL